MGTGTWIKSRHESHVKWDQVSSQASLIFCFWAVVSVDLRSPWVILTRRGSKQSFVYCLPQLARKELDTFIFI